MKFLFLAFSALCFSLCAQAKSVDLDQFESDRYAYALRCPDGLISSMRYHWNQLGVSIEANQTSFGQAFKESLKKVSRADDNPSFRIVLENAQRRILQDVDWRSDIELVGTSMGLPVQIDGCKVEVLWADVELPGASYPIRIGRAPLLEEMRPMDVLLLGLWTEYRSSGSKIARVLLRPVEF